MTPTPLHKTQRYLIWTAPVVAILVLICYQWLDKPLAIFAHQLMPDASGSALSEHLALFLTNIVYCLFIPIFIIYFLLRLAKKPGTALHCAELICMTVPFTFFIKNALQFFFGRTSPRYEGYNYLVFQHTPALYPFHWLDSAGGCFPSGHMSLMSAFVVAFCLYYKNPLWKLIWGALTLILGGLLILLNYHFLGDLIAGFYLGSSISLALFLLQNSAQSHGHDRDRQSSLFPKSR